MFRGEMDSHSAFLDMQSGAGGTEAQDWAQMLCACTCAGEPRTASPAR
jgi:protein subunit release factor A